MASFQRQFDLFRNNNIDYSNKNAFTDISINIKIINEWQQKISNHQSMIFENDNKNLYQSSLFESQPEELEEKFNPLELTPLSLNFWKWPKPIHEGPAVYFVIDKLQEPNKNIILYIGETFSADTRWKGDHDCKNYLANYSEKLQKVGLRTNLNIRFWLDVPNKTKERRKLEQKLIQTWLPPFNKETRRIWSTPFTSQIN